MAGRELLPPDPLTFLPSSSSQQYHDPPHTRLFRPETSNTIKEILPPDPLLHAICSRGSWSPRVGYNFNMVDQMEFPSLPSVEKQVDQDVIPSALNMPKSVPDVSFATIAAGAAPAMKPLFEPLKFPGKHAGTKDGKSAISFSLPEVQAGRRRYDHTLVAKFTAGRPTMEDIRRTFETHWNLAGRAAIGSWHDGRHVLVVLQSEEDARRVLASPLKMVKHSLFRIFRWSPAFNVRRESPTITTWLRLPGIPMDLYDPGFIEPMVAPFAKFIDVDARTKALTNPNFARVCVELDVTKIIPPEVWISLPEERSYWQSIVVEGKLKFCLKCRCHGHDLSSCRKKPPATVHDQPSVQPRNGRPTEGESQSEIQHVTDTKTNEVKEATKPGSQKGKARAKPPSLPTPRSSELEVSARVDHKASKDVQIQKGDKEDSDGTSKDPNSQNHDDKHQWRKASKKQAIKIAGFKKHFPSKKGQKIETTKSNLPNTKNIFDLLECSTIPAPCDVMAESRVQADAQHLQEEEEGRDPEPGRVDLPPNTQEEVKKPDKFVEMAMAQLATQPSRSILKKMTGEEGKHITISSSDRTTKETQEKEGDGEEQTISTLGVQKGDSISKISHDV